MLGRGAAGGRAAEEAAGISAAAGAEAVTTTTAASTTPCGRTRAASVCASDFDFCLDPVLPNFFVPSRCYAKRSAHMLQLPGPLHGQRPKSIQTSRCQSTACCLPLT